MKNPTLLSGLLCMALLLSSPPITVGDSGPQNHPTNACSSPYHVSHAGWDFCWQQDDVRVQGLELTQLYFHGESVIWRMGVPFTITQYDSGAPVVYGPFKDVFGTPGSASVPGYGRGAMTIPWADCPRFLAGGTLLHGDKVCVETRDGPEPAVNIWSRFNVFNYRFIQGWELDAKGHITPMILMGGNLIDGNLGAAGANHHHHLYWRIDFDVASPGNDVFQSYGACQTAVPAPLVCGILGAAQPAWTDALLEGKHQNSAETLTKWRVKDLLDLNAQGNPKSYEFTLGSYTPADSFSSFDAMVVEYKGDTTELGYEVPTNPFDGDRALDAYITPPEVLTDPVVWAVLHIYHDTRDEDRNSMSYHYASLNIRPNNFLDENPGERTYP
jgi:hypothetical protein